MHALRDRHEAEIVEFLRAMGRPRISLGAVLSQALPDGIGPGEAIVLAGRPGVGKTRLGCMVAAQTDAHVVFVSNEMQPAFIYLLILQAMCGYNYLDRTKSVDERLNEFQTDKASLSRIWVIQQREITSVFEAVDQLIPDGEPALIIADHIALFNGPERQSEHERKTAIVETWRQGISEKRRAAILIAHINRTGAASAKPALEHLAGTGSLETVADAVVAVRQAEDGAGLQMHVLKNRTGPLREAEASFDLGSMSTLH